MSDDRWRAIPALLGEVMAKALDEFDGRLAEEGHPDLRRGHSCVFRFISREGSTLTELAESAGLTKQAVGEVVTDLEQMGYVERVPHPSDGRAKIVRLTPRGHDACDTGRQIFGEIEARWGRVVGEERMAACREVLEALCAEDREPVGA